MAELLDFPVCLAALALVAQRGRIVWPRGMSALLLWIVVQAVFLPLCGVLLLGVEFFCLLLLLAFTVFAIAQLYGEGDRLDSLMRVYMASYVFVALFGLVQLALPLAGLPGILVTQWIIHGRVARINGFNSEPSFFATYLILGWIMMVELRHSKARITQGRLWKWAMVAVTLSLLLSTSKTCWVVMGVELVARLIPVVWRVFCNVVWQVRNGYALLPLPRNRVVVSVLLTVVMVAGAVRFIATHIDPLVFLNGTGLGGTPAHSYNTRTDGALATLAAFREHPIVGRSLGGVPVAIAADAGVVVHGMEEVRLYWGFPVILDLLVASGVIGIIPFLVFLYTNTFGAIRLSKRYWPNERAKWLRALARAMIFEWIMLLADQNVLRVYLWFHFAMVTVVAYQLEFCPVAVAEASRPLVPPVDFLAGPDGEMAPTA